MHGCCHSKHTETGEGGKKCCMPKLCCPTPNVGTIDRVIRLVIGGLLIAGVFIGPMTPWGWLGVPLVISALFGWCGLYTVCGVNTCGCGKKSSSCCDDKAKTEKAEKSCCGGAHHHGHDHGDTPAA